MDNLDACHIMADGEILNPHKEELKLHKAVIYGDKYLSAKLSKRVSCAIKDLPIRLKFNYNHSTKEAIELGIAKDPTLVLDDKIFIEGLISAEEIKEIFKKLIQD